MSDLIKYVPSNQGGKLLIYENNVFRKKSSVGDTSYWVCLNESCKGKLNLLFGAIKSKSDHNHEPDIARVIGIEQKNGVKSIAVQSTYCNLKSVYNDATEKVFSSIQLPADEIANGLKTFDQIKKTISRARASRFPPLPRSRGDIDVPSNLQSSSTEKFFKVSNGADDKILVFATDTFLKFLCEADHVYSDGTFKSVPNLFHSLYTLHVMRNGIMIPAVYALLPDSTMLTYTRLFRIIQDLCFEINLTWQPKKFTTDFEISTIKAISLIFPFCQLKCCLFHFSQSIWRNVGKHGLVQRYKANDGDVKMAVKRIAALPFLIVDDIDDVYELIKFEAPDDNDFKNFLDYFEHTYLFNDARFPKEIWNHFDDRDPRTNNHVEGWHSALNKAVGRHHANIYQFIETIIKQQNNYEVQILIASNGTRPKPNKKYAAINEKILNLTKDYSENLISSLEFIDKVKHCLFLSA